MNFFNRALYNLVLSLRGLYARIGVQTHQLALILQVKLMMDDRKPNTFNQRQKQKETSKVLTRATIWGIVGSAFMGLVFLYAFLLPAEPLLQTTLYFSVYIVFMAMLLITEVSNLLLDSKDNTIILPAPVNARTILLARLLHIVIIVMRTALPMMLAGWIFTGIADGWKAAVLFPWICVLAILFTVFLVNAFYLLILRLVSVQRFKNIIAYMQIVLSIVIFAAYQLLPRMMNNGVFDNIRFQQVSWSIYFPSQWFGALYQLVVNGETGRLVVTGAILSVAVPLFAFLILIKYLAPAFNRKIGALGGGETTAPLTQKQKVKFKKGGGLAERLSNKLAGSYAEQAAFRLAWNISSRSRDFKMKVYPSIGYQLVYVLIFFVSGKKKFSLEGFRLMEMPAFILIMTLVYLSSFSINTIITQLQMSEKPKAAWVFFTAPLSQPGQVISGAFKAMLVKFLIPTFIVIGTITMIITEGRIAPHLLVGFCNVVMSCTLFAYIFLKKFPFSAPYKTSSRSGNIILSILTSFLPFIIGTLHVVFRKYLIVLGLLALAALAFTYWLLRLMQQQGWATILSKYSEE